MNVPARFFLSSREILATASGASLNLGRTCPFSLPQHCDVREPEALAVALMSTSFSFLHAGSPDGESFHLTRLQGRSGTEWSSGWTPEDVRMKHASVLCHLDERAQSWNAAGIVDAERMGRTAAKVENTEKVSEGSVIGRSSLQVEHVAKQIDASRISFGPPPAFDASSPAVPRVRVRARSGRAPRSSPCTCSTQGPWSWHFLRAQESSQR